MISKAEIEALREYDTALLANTLDYISDYPPHTFYMGGDIASLTPGLGPHVGVAYTICLDSSTPGGEETADDYWAQMEQMEAAEAPAIWVVQANGSRPDHECVLGDGMAKTLYSVGCVACVSNSRARDMSGLLTTPFGFYGRGTAVHHCKLRFSRKNEPVSVGGITVSSGELIHASSEGVIRIPEKHVDKLLQKAPAMRAFEHVAHTVLRRTDLSLTKKKEQVTHLLGEYGFLGETEL